MASLGTTAPFMIVQSNSKTLGSGLVPYTRANFAIGWRERNPVTRNLRIITGIALFVFVAMHLLNMAMGLISLEALDQSRVNFMFLWHNPVGSFVLATSLLIHGALGLVAVYWRNTLQMTRYDLIQTVSALLIIPLLASHVLGVTLAANMLAFEPSYHSILAVFWVQAPAEGLRQVLVVGVTWIHGCTGLFTWMRLKAWWPKVAVIAYPLAVIIPVSALLGFVEAGNQVIELSANSVAIAPSISPEAAAERAALFDLYNTIKWTIILSYIAIVAVVLIARKIRLSIANTGMVTLSYLTGDTIRIEGGISLLEAAELHDLPHANICKGRGRCGTCRVRIMSSSIELPAPSEMERLTLERFNAPDNVRLACQLVPVSGKIELERLLPPDAGREALMPSANTEKNDVSDLNEQMI